MHISDGYLTLLTCIIMFLVALPFWIIGIRKMREKLNARSVPRYRIALGVLLS